LSTDAEPERSGVEDSPPEDREDRQHALKGRAAAAGEDRDVSRCGAVTAARYRTIHGEGAARLDEGAHAPDLRRVGRAHLKPDLAGSEARQNAILALHHIRAGRGRGQAGDDDIDFFRHFARGRRP
jgi:hypothetical protein